MNREIRFKGKSISTGKWLYGCLLKNEEGKFAVVKPFKVNMDNECSCCEVEEETIGQFTGMKDKNGKEIYEGDILQTSIVKDSIGVVEWNFEHATFVVRMKNSSQWYFLDKSNQIIGNIYDNKDLLNE